MGPEEVGEGFNFSCHLSIRDGHAFIEWHGGRVTDVAMEGFIGDAFEFGF